MTCDWTKCNREPVYERGDDLLLESTVSYIQDGVGDLFKALRLW